MAQTSLGRGHQIGVDGQTTITFTNPGGSPAISGTISYNKRNIRLVHNGETVRTLDEDGDIVALTFGSEFLEGVFTFIPYGSTYANATASRQLPSLGASAAISGFDIFVMGSFADALNTNGATTQPWIYEGGGEDNQNAGLEPSTLTITLRRYPAITSATVIS